MGFAGTSAHTKTTLDVVYRLASGPIRGSGKKKLLQNSWKFLYVLGRVYTIMQDHKNSPCFARGRVLDLQKHAKRKFRENMAKKGFWS